MSGTKQTPGVLCREVRGRLLRWLDSDVVESERARIAEHLAVCPACDIEAQELRRVRGLLREEPDPGAVLPSGSQVATWVLEREAARPRPGVWLPGLSLAAAALVLVAWFGRHGEDRQAEPSRRATSISLPALIVNDDEHAGRQVLLAPEAAGTAR